ncbi:integrase catalytic domain-containing protein [Phocaeicola plebeius]
MRDLYISYKWLINKGISRKTIEFWRERNISVVKKDGISAYVLYDSIPAPTRAKLPSKEAIIKEFERQKDEDSIDYFYEILSKAKDENFPLYRDVYSKHFNDERVVEYSQKHAVIEEILTIRYEYKEEGTRCPSRDVWKAYCKIYPDDYVYEYFLNVMKKAEDEGIERILIKQNVPAKRKFDARYTKMVIDCLSSKKRYNQPQIFDKICKACEKKGWEKPSLSWVKLKIKEQYMVGGSRDGKNYEFYNRRPYMGLLKAQNANSQWQIDGWRLPFYMKGFETLSIFWVIDSYSGKVLGSFIDSSENTETILKGIESAVKETGVLPFEIVSDNHSFNQTKEAEDFKGKLSRIGVTWTVSMNPRHKSKVERSFRTFGDNFCKDEYGYTGQGIKSRMKNGRPSQEYIDKAVKNPLTREQIILIAGRCIEAYNNTIGTDGKSPNMRYDEAVNDESRRKKSFKMSELDLISLFIRRSEATARRGQITIERGGVKYEYLMNAKQYYKLNNCKYGIRYASFDEIYLYDIDTDKYIDCLKRKKYAHGALADQTEEDIELINRHSGRLRGIENAIKQEQERIYKEAVSIDPDAAYVMNPLLTPKSDFEEYRRNGNLIKFADRHGIRPEDVPEIKVECEKETSEPEYRKRRKAESPLHCEKKVTIDLSSLDER